MNSELENTEYKNKLKNMLNNNQIDFNSLLDIKEIYNKKDYDLLYGNDRDYLKYFFIEVLKRDPKILDKFYYNYFVKKKDGLFQKSPLDKVRCFPLLSDYEVAKTAVLAYGFNIGYLPNKLRNKKELVNLSRDYINNNLVNISSDDLKDYIMFDNKYAIYRYFLKSRQYYPFPTFLANFSVEQKIKATVLEFLDYLVNYRELYNVDMAFNLWGVINQNIIENNDYNNFLLANVTLDGIPLISFVKYLVGEKDMRNIFQMNPVPYVTFDLSKKEKNSVNNMIITMQKKHTTFIDIMKRIEEKIEKGYYPSDFVPFTNNFLQAINEGRVIGERDYLISLISVYKDVFNYSLVVINNNLISMEELNQIKNDLRL